MLFEGNIKHRVNFLIINSLAEAAQGLSCTFSPWHAIYFLWSPFHENRQTEGGKYIILDSFEV